MKWRGEKKEKMRVISFCADSYVEPTRKEVFFIAEPPLLL